MKKIVAAVLVLLILAIGVGVIWYMSVPHDAKEQLAYAEKLEKVLRGESLTKGPKELGPQLEKTVGAYEKVGVKFGKGAEAAEGLKRAAKVWEEVGQDDGKAMEVLERLVKDYEGVEDGGFGLRELARILRRQGDAIKLGKPTEWGGAVEKYKAAIGKLEEYRGRLDDYRWKHGGELPAELEKAAKLDEVLMEQGRIWQDGMGEPLIHAIETFTRFLKEFPQSELRPEALYRLAEAYKAAREYERAIAIYSQLLEEFPKSEWAAKGLFAKGQLLADKMDKHEEAAREFARLQEEHPDSPLKEQASGRARQEGGKAGQDASDKYGKSRYGGAIPFDTRSDKPMPPAAMFAIFAKQKLDAKKYDLDVRFVPAEHRIAVKGTLRVGNDGEDKREILLMLGSLMEIGKGGVTVDGKEMKYAHRGETLQIQLPEEMKTGGEVVLGFEYTGVYGAPMPGMPEFGEGGEEKPEAGSEPRPSGSDGATTQAQDGSLPDGRGSDSPSATAPAEQAKELMKMVDFQMGLGEFGYGLSGAMWYPVTIMGDVFDAHVVIHVPGKIEAVCSGEMVKREKSEVEEKEGVFEFETRQPVFGLYFAYGPYVMQEERVGGIHYYTYLREEDKGKHQEYVGVAGRILDFYSSKFVLFPYEKMAIVESPLPPFLGGVGPASLMFLHERMVSHAGTPECLLAHELAHQWFGNLVPITMTEGYNQWLSEGFATYCDALYTEHTEGAKALAAHMEKYGQMFFQYFMMARAGEGAIKTTYPGMALYRPVIYEKGAIVLHMLRKVMGDAKFFALMREYVETYKNKPTTVDDFEKLAGKVNGEDLSWFFSQWIDRTVFAHYKVNVEVGEKPEARSQKPEGGTAAPPGFGVKVTISQPDELVKMPADVTLIGIAGERQVVANVMLDKREQVVEVVCAFRPVQVIVDEGGWVLKRPGSDNIWPKVETKTK